MTSRPSRAGSRTLGVLAWAVAAVLAGTLAWWAVGLVTSGTRGAGDGVLSAAQVDAALAEELLAATPTTTPTTPTTPPTATPTPAPEPSAAPPTAPGTVARTWVLAGGEVGASCAGAVITLLYATPADGWRVEVEDAGPDDIRVELRRNGATIDVRAECVAGVPQPEIETESERD